MKQIFIVMTLFLSLRTMSQAKSTFQGHVESSTTVVQATDGFVQNKGQLHNHAGQVQPGIGYYLNQGSFSLFLLENGIAYQFTKVHFSDHKDKVQNKLVPRGESTLQKLQTELHTETARMDLVLLGCNPHSKIVAEDKSTDYINYLNQGITEIHSYRKITYKNIYPHIDWVIYLEGTSVKYDFEVFPGGDPSKIRLGFKYQDSLSLDDHGGFRISNALGTIVEHKPICKQKNAMIKSRFRLANNCIMFDIGEYNTKQKLVIDPLLEWSTYYGGTSEQYGYSCATDAQGNVYLAGQTGSTVGIASGGHQNTFGGNLKDAFLVKFNSSGVRQWATYYGGTLDDMGFGCCTDLSGNVYLAGTTSSSANISSTGHQNTLGGNADAFLVKFNSNGQRLWSTYYGGPQYDDGSSCCVDPAGNVYLSGTSQSSVAISSGGHQNLPGGITDAFLVKFNSSGVRQWATYYGGDGLDYGTSCASDVQGNLYMSGNTTSSAGIASGGHQNLVSPTFSNSIYDAFLVKFNNNGVRTWATYYGGMGNDYGFDCVADASLNVYLCGSTQGGNDIAFSGYQANFGGGSQDGFVVKFDVSGIRIWGTYYGGGDADGYTGCSVNTGGDLFVSGGTWSSSGIAFGGYQNYYKAGLDAFITKFNGTGILQWASYFSGYGYDYGRDCATDAAGSVYLAGTTDSQVGFGVGGHQNTMASFQLHGFLSKFCGSLPAFSSISGNTLVCSVGPQIYSVPPSTVALVYAWSAPSGWNGASNAYSISLLPGSAGINSVPGNSGLISVFAVNNACTSSSVQTLSVTVISASVNANKSSTLICSGNTVSVWGGGANTYTWSSGVINNVPFSPTATAIYTVTGTANNGCINSAQIQVTVAQPFQMTITSNPATVCPGKSATLTLITGGAFSISPGWQNLKKVVTPTTITTYSATGFNGCIDTANVTVNVAQPITHTKDSVHCAGDLVSLYAQGANSYTWTSSQGTASSSSFTLIPISPTAYTVTGLDAFGCLSSVADTVQINACLGLKSLQDSPEFLIYPNPANGVFEISLAESSQFILVTTLGQEILRGFFSPGKQTIDLTLQPSGLYLLKLSLHNRDTVLKLIKD